MTLPSAQNTLRVYFNSHWHLARALLRAASPHIFTSAKKDLIVMSFMISAGKGMQCVRDPERVT